MKNTLNLVKKYWIFILLIATILLGMYLYSLPKPLPPVTEIPKPTPIPTTPITSLPSLNTGFNSTSQIIWRLDKLDLPEKLSVLHISPPVSDSSFYQPIAKTLGLKETPTKIPNLPIYIFNSSDNATDYYVNLKDRLAKYQTNLLLKPAPTSGTKNTPDTLLNLLATTLTPIINLPKDFSLRSGDFDYEVIDGERYVPATANNATFIQITLDYEYNGYPIKYRGIPAVTAKYSIYGPLISVSYALPPSEIQPSADYSLKNFDQIKKTPANQFEVISISGNKAFTLSDQDEIIKTTTITNGYLGYLMTPNVSVIAPYIFLTGISQSKTYGSLNVVLATPALNLQPQE